MQLDRQWAKRLHPPNQFLDGAQMAELVDALASGASALYGRGSSSLLLGTKIQFSLNQIAFQPTIVLHLY